MQSAQDQAAPAAGSPTAEPTVYAALKRKAQNMQKPTAELAASLLAAIVRSNIYAAVLDEGEE
jgi:hypothetical protein